MSLSWAVSHLKKNETPCSMTPTLIAARQALEKEAKRLRIKTEISGTSSPPAQKVSKTFLLNTLRNVSGTNRTMEEKKYEKWAIQQRQKKEEFATSSSRTSHRDRSCGRVRQAAAASNADREYCSKEVRETSKLQCDVEDDESKQKRSKRNREDEEDWEVVNSSKTSTARRDRSRSKERIKVEDGASKADVVEYHSKRSRARSRSRERIKVEEDTSKAEVAEYHSKRSRARSQLEDEVPLSASHRDRSRSRERTLVSTKTGLVELFSKRARARSRMGEIDDAQHQDQRINTLQDEELELEQSSTRSSSSHRDRSKSREEIQIRTEKAASKEDEERYRQPCEQLDDAWQGRSRSREREDKENVERKKKKKERKEKKSERRAAVKDFPEGGGSEKKRRRKYESDSERDILELENGPPRPEVSDDFGSTAGEHIEGLKSLSPRGIRSEKRAMLIAAQEDSGLTKKTGCASKMDADTAISGGGPESGVRPQERWGNDGFFALEAAKAAAEEQRRLNRIKQKEARLQAQVEEEQALRKRALDQLTAGGRASRQAQALEAAAEEDGVRRRKGPDASRLSFETQDDAGESGEGE